MWESKEGWGLESLVVLCPRTQARAQASKRRQEAFGSKTIRKACLQILPNSWLNGADSLATPPLGDSLLPRATLNS